MIDAVKKISFVEKISKERGLKSSKIGNVISTERRVIYLIQAPDTSGRNAYYFIAVHPELENTFVEAVEAGPTHLEDFGTVIFSGFGDVVPDPVKKYMTKRYGLNIK